MSFAFVLQHFFSFHTYRVDNGIEQLNKVAQGVHVAELSARKILANENYHFAAVAVHACQKPGQE